MENKQSEPSEGAKKWYPAYRITFQTPNGFILKGRDDSRTPCGSTRKEQLCGPWYNARAEKPLMSAKNSRIEGQTGAMKQLLLLRCDSLDGPPPHTQPPYLSADIKESLMALQRKIFCPRLHLCQTRQLANTEERMKWSLALGRLRTCFHRQV